MSGAADLHPELAALALALGVALGKAALGVVRKRKDKRESEPGMVQRALLRQAQIDRLLETRRQALGLDRLLLLAAHNGGPISDPATPLYVTASGEAKVPGIRYIGQEWIRRPIATFDHTYRSLLRDVYTAPSKRVVLITNELPELSPLREAYEREDLAAICVAECWDAPHRDYYISGAVQDVSAMDTSARSRMTGVASEVRTLLQAPL